MPPAEEAQSPNHQITREVPGKWKLEQLNLSAERANVGSSVSKVTDFYYSVRGFGFGLMFRLFIMLIAMP